MKASTQYLAIALIAAAFAACAQPASDAAATDTAADVTAINALRDREQALLNSGSSDGLDQVYAANVAMMPPGEPAKNGLDAVRPWVAAMFEQVTMNASYTSSDVTVSGDWAVDRYTATLTITPKAGGAPMQETIKGVHILQRGADGSWRVTQDVWNSDAPAPPPAAAPPSGN